MTDTPAPKGHWPAGKRRHKDIGNWSRVRLTLTRLVDEESQPGVRSRIAVANALGVSARAVARWIKGEDMPDEDMQALVRTWCAEQVARIKADRAATRAANRSK